MGSPAAVSEDPYVGRVLAQRYRIDRILQHGGMGTVYEGENLAVGRRVAIKILHPYFAQFDECQERFEREARAAAYIGHPSVIDVLDLGRTERGVPFMVMALLEGETLYGWLSRRGPLAVGDAVRVLIEVASALAAAHRAGIVHRDLKPENVFVLMREGEIQGVKILDFGIAKFRNRAEARITGDGIILGTPAYMAPEQALGQDPDERADIYSAGVLLFELVSGRLPWHGDTNAMLSAMVSFDAPRLDAAVPWAPPALADLVARAMAREPDARFQTADELLFALEQILETVDLEAGGRALARWRDTPSGFRGVALGRPARGTAPWAGATTSHAEVVPSDVMSVTIGHAASRPFGRRWWLAFSVAVTLALHLASGMPIGRKSVVVAAPGAPAPAPRATVTTVGQLCPLSPAEPDSRPLVTPLPLADAPPVFGVAATDLPMEGVAPARRSERSGPRTPAPRRVTFGAADAPVPEAVAQQEPPTLRTLPFEAVY